MVRGNVDQEKRGGEYGGMVRAMEGGGVDEGRVLGKEIGGGEVG